MIHIAFVRVDDSEPLEKAIKRFKRMVEKEGIIREWKKREYYEKPSTINNRKKSSGAETNEEASENSVNEELLIGRRSNRVDSTVFYGH